MARRILGGVAAWLVSILPLAIVNGIAAFGWVSVGVAAVAGALTLVLGVALGAFTAGWIGGRAPDLSSAQTPDDEPSGYMGARGALWSAGLAGALYALTMGAVLFAAAQADLLPTIILKHPLRMSAAVISVACVMVGLALLVGWFAGRQSAEAETNRQTLPQQAGSPRMGQASQRPNPTSSIRPAAPTRPISHLGQSSPHSQRPPQAPLRPPASSPAPAQRHRERQWEPEEESLDWEGLPDLRGKTGGGDDPYGDWDSRAPAPPPLRRERR